jgi:hypothetical protein
MGFFSNLFKKKPVIIDPFWGKMTFIKINKKPEANYIECKPFFEPINQNIEVFIDAETSEPSVEQKQFFLKIQKNYQEITKLVTPIIENEFQNWKDGMKVIDFSKEFTPVGITLPRFEKTPINWSISFETVHDLDHQIEITMQDFEAIGILIDG